MNSKTAFILNIFILIIITEFTAGIELIDKLPGSGPIFILQPPNVVLFMNDHNMVIDCIVHGDPQPEVKWINTGGDNNEQYVHDMPGLLSTFSNNSLLFHSFRADRYNQLIHSTGYRCHASNIHGSIVSTVTTVKAVVDQEYRTQVYDEYVILGNTAVMKCNIPSYITDYVEVTAWIINDDVRVTTKYQSGSRFSLLYNSNLHVRDVKLTDSDTIFKCVTKHKATKLTKVSDKAGRLYVTETSSSIPPRILDYASVIEAKRGQQIEFPCVAQGSPIIKYSWCFKTEITHECSNLGLINDGNRQRMKSLIVLNSSLLLTSLQHTDQGYYLCNVTNDIGQAHSVIELQVIEPLTVFVHPQKQLVDAGQPINLKCVISGRPIKSVIWMRNGRIIKKNEHHIVADEDLVLTFKSANRETSGMFQCFVNNGLTTVQAVAEVTLTSFRPVITSSLKPDILRPGRKITLTCSASGIPLPKIFWTLAENIIRSDRVRIALKEQVEHKIITSSLTIVNVKSSDGGQYGCTAVNKAGKEVHFVNIQVYGRPEVRPIKNITVVGGDKLLINCHVFGYPVKDIQWTIDDKPLHSTNNLKLFDNGTLLIRSSEPNVHSGKFTCIASDNSGSISARNHGWIKVIAKPALNRWLKTRVVKDGDKLALFCAVRSGDLPVEFTWKLNGEDIPYQMPATITDSTDFSSLKIKRITHNYSGNYSCEAANVAGVALEYTVVHVEGPPKWIRKPASTSFDGQIYWIHCLAKSYPVPSVKWYRLHPGNKEEAIENTTNTFIYNNGTLLLKGVADENEGKYKCKVSNGVEPDLSETLLILSGDKPVIQNPKDVIYASFGQQIRIQCSATGTGILTAVWSKENKPIRFQQNSRYNMKNSQTKSEMTSILTITEAMLNDFGQYKCKVSNEYGTDVMNTMVTYKDLPLPLDGNGIRHNVINPTNHDGDRNVEAKILDFEQSSLNGTTNGQENNEIFGLVLLYVIPTITAAIVLFVVLVIFCILLKRQSKLHGTSRNADDNDYKSLERQKIGGSTGEWKADGTLPKTAESDNAEYHRYYQTHRFRSTGSDDFYASPHDGAEIQPYATFTSDRIKKSSDGTFVELASFN